MNKLAILLLLLSNPAFARSANNVYVMPSSGNLPAWGQVALGSSSAVTGESAGACYATSSSSGLLFGTLPVADGGTALGSTPSNGQLLIGNGTGYSLANITAGSNVTITNGSGTITIAASSGSSFQSAVQHVDTTSTTASGSSFTATATAASITPSSSSNRIKITVTGYFRATNVNSFPCNISIFRGTTNLGGTSGYFVTANGSLATATDFNGAMTYIDSPATTSSTTYTVEIQSPSGGTSECVWNRETGGSAAIILEEIQ